MTKLNPKTDKRGQNRVLIDILILVIPLGKHMNTHTHLIRYSALCHTKPKKLSLGLTTVNEEIDKSPGSSAS